MYRRDQIVNPETGRKILVGGATYMNLFGGKPQGSQAFVCEWCKQRREPEKCTLITYEQAQWHHVRNGPPVPCAHAAAIGLSLR